MQPVTVNEREIPLQQIAESLFVKCKTTAYANDHYNSVSVAGNTLASDTTRLPVNNHIDYL